MSTNSIAELQNRIAILESQVAALLAQKKPEPGPLDWRSTLGMFTGDEVMQRISAEALRYREQDREAARSDPDYFSEDQPQ